MAVVKQESKALKYFISQGRRSFVFFPSVLFLLIELGELCINFLAEGIDGRGTLQVKFLGIRGPFKVHLLRKIKVKREQRLAVVYHLATVGQKHCIKGFCGYQSLTALFNRVLACLARVCFFNDIKTISRFKSFFVFLKSNRIFLLTLPCFLQKTEIIKPNVLLLQLLKLHDRYHLRSELFVDLPNLNELLIL